MSSFLHILLTILLCSGIAQAQSSSTDEPQQSCPTGCQCNYITRVVRCQSNGFSSLPAIFPSYTTTLILTGNVLTDLPADSFPGLFNLISLNLTYCQIRNISPGAFNGLDNLHILTLQFNHLSYLTVEMFTGMTSLRELNLAQNQLQVLSAGVFEALPTLQVLDLSNNPLFQLDDEAFSGISSLASLYLRQGQQVSIPVVALQNLTNLRTLDISLNAVGSIPPRAFATLGSLSMLYLNNMEVDTLDVGVFEGLNEVTTIDLAYNSLETLAPEVFQALPTLDTLILTGNEWDCSCPMQSFIQWLQQTSINYYSTPWYCATPAHNRGYVVYSTALQDFACEPLITQRPSNAILNYGQRANFLCQAIGDPEPTIQWYTPDGSLVSSTSNSENTFTAISGTVLIIQYAQEDTAGIYNCTATNERGQASALFQVVVDGVPTTTLAPPEQSVDITQMISPTPVEPSRPSCTNSILQIWANEVTDNTLTVTWSPYFGEETLTGYLVQVHIFGDVQTNSFYVNWTEASYTLRNLLPNTGYTVCAAYLLEKCPLVIAQEQCREIQTQGEDPYLVALRSKHRNEIIGTALASCLGTLFLMASVFLILWHRRKPRKYTHYDFKATKDTAAFAGIPEVDNDNDVCVSDTLKPVTTQSKPHPEGTSYTNLAVQPDEMYENEYVTHPVTEKISNVEHSADVHFDVVTPPPEYNGDAAEIKEEVNANTTASMKSASTAPCEDDDNDDDNLSVGKELKDSPSKVKKSKQSLNSQDSSDSNNMEMTNLGNLNLNGEATLGYHVEIV